MGFEQDLMRIALLGTEFQPEAAPEPLPGGLGAPAAPQAPAGGAFPTRGGLAETIGGVGGEGAFRVDGGVQEAGAFRRSALSDFLRRQTGVAKGDPNLIRLPDGTTVRRKSDGTFETLGGIRVARLRPGEVSQIGGVGEAAAEEAERGPAARSIIKQDEPGELSPEQRAEATRLFGERDQRLSVVDPRTAKGSRTLEALRAAVSQATPQNVDQLLAAAFQGAQEPTRGELVEEQRGERRREREEQRAFRREELGIKEGRTKQREIDAAAGGVIQRSQRLEATAQQAITRAQRDQASGTIDAGTANTQILAAQKQVNAAQALRQSAMQRRQFAIDNPDQPFNAFAFQFATDEDFTGGRGFPKTAAVTAAEQEQQRVRTTQERERFAQRFGRGALTGGGGRVLATNPQITQPELEEKLIRSFFDKDLVKTKRRLSKAARDVLAGGIDQPGGLRELNIEFGNLLGGLRQDAAGDPGFNPAQTEEEARSSFAQLLTRLADQLEQKRFRRIKIKSRLKGPQLRAHRSRLEGGLSVAEAQTRDFERRAGVQPPDELRELFGAPLEALRGAFGGG